MLMLMKNPDDGRRLDVAAENVHVLEALGWSRVNPPKKKAAPKRSARGKKPAAKSTAKKS